MNCKFSSKMKIIFSFVVCFVIFSQMTYAQSFTVTGTVTDSEGTLPGVNVAVIGTARGTATDADGRYSIEVPNQDAILLFSFIGFNDVEEMVGLRRIINVQMSESASELEELVVIGYGTMRKVNLTGSVSTVNVENEMLSRPLSNVSQALSGMAAGVQVLQNSGQPGSDGANIRIRGIGTLNSAGPLVLIDGMEGNIGDVNANDVASISILKDAASCAIYGNRGANGVILITTKQGERGKIRVNYSGYFSLTQPANLIEMVTNSADYFELMNESRTNIGQSPIFSQATIDAFREAEKNPNGIGPNGYPNYVVYPNTDWYKTVFENRMVHEHTISILGATDKVNFNFSGGYRDNPGLIENSGEKRYTVRSNITVDITDWLQVGNRTWGFITDLGRNNLGEFLNGIGSTKSSPAIYPFYDGKYGAPEAPEEDTQALNVVQWLNHSGGSFHNARINTTLFATLTLFKDLKYRISFDYMRYWTEHLFHQKSTGRWSFRTDQWIIPPPPPESLQSMFYTQGQKRHRFEQMLTYNKTFNRIHEVGALAGYEEMYFYQYTVDAQKVGLPDPSITVLSRATTMHNITGGMTDYSSRSFFGRVTYAYDSRYLFEMNLRYDGSSRFAPESRWGLFPSFSAGWRITQEQFMANIPVDNLKLRASWGRLGNNSVGNYPWQSTYGGANYAFGNALTSGLAITTLANTILEWETTTTSNIGLEVAVLNNRLSAEIDVYDRLTYGILYNPAIYATMGTVGAPQQNIAEMSNKGIELTLGWNDRINRLRYGVRGNFSYNKNLVTKYRGNLVRGWVTPEAGGNPVWQTNLGDVSTGGSNRIMEGKIYNEWYMLQPYQGSQQYFNSDGTVNKDGGPRDGMIRTEQDMEWLLAMRADGYTFLPNQNVRQNGIWYGDYIYADLNNDGSYGNAGDHDFRDVSNMPKYHFGFQAYASWNNFDFSMNWGGAGGFKLYYYAVGRNSSGTIYGYLIPKAAADDRYFYDPDNPNDPRTNQTSKRPRLTNDSGGQSASTNTLWLEKGDFLKLRNLTFGYTLPSNLSQRVYMQSLRVFVSGENLLTITQFTGIDPEMRANMGYVTLRQYAFGINVSF